MSEYIDKDYDYENCLLKNKLNIDSKTKLDQAESDFAIVRLKELLEKNYFEPTKEFLYSIHKYIFGDVYPFAGTIRNVPIVKEEKILKRLSVDYIKPENIDSELDNIFKRINNISLDDLSSEEKIDFVTKIISDIWKVHPFREGNTRTTLVFLRLYLKSYGITFSSELFSRGGNFKYMRDALVASAFEASDLGVERNYMYLKRVISDIIEDDLVQKRGGL